jgi:imidazolonepropionase-like amidohydrolase
MDDRLGTIKVGNFADLVLLGKNPLDDIKNTRTVEAVVVGGCLVPR